MSCGAGSRAAHWVDGNGHAALRAIADLTERVKKLEAIISKPSREAPKFVQRGPVLSGRPSRGREDEEWASGKDDAG